MAEVNSKISRELEAKDNFLCIPVYEGEEMTITINGDRVTTLIIPYHGKIKMYLARDAKPITYK